MTHSQQITETLNDLYQRQTEEKIKTITRLNPIILLFNTTVLITGYWYDAGVGFYLLTGVAYLLLITQYISIRWGKYYLSTTIHVLAPPIMLTLSSYLCRNQMGVEYLLFSNYLLPFQFIRNKWAIILYYTFVTICILTIEMELDIGYYLIDMDTALKLRLPVLIFAFLFFGMLLFSLISEYNNSKEEVENTVKILEKNSRELENKNKELEQLSEIKDKFLSIMSHDIRNPLASIQGSLLLLQNDRLKPEENSFLLRKLHAQTNQTTLLLDNIIKWVQARGVQKTAVVSDVLLFQVIQDIRKLFELQMLEKEVRLINLIPEKIYIPSDKNIVALILRNFIHNALKFSSHGDEITITLTEDESNFIVSVMDNGYGLPPQYQINTMEQSVDAVIIKEKGHGIGLALCQYFAKLINGQIKAVNNEEKGATFSLIIPKIPIMGNNLSN
ncbi:MAG: HAMP domain-containing sensor histidine kinase [Cytophagaceae bacterium]